MQADSRANDSNDIWIPAVFGCPIKNCSRWEDIKWICKEDRKPLYLNKDGIIRCEKKATKSIYCHSAPIHSWKFRCGSHRGLFINADLQTCVKMFYNSKLFRLTIKTHKGFLDDLNVAVKKQRNEVSGTFEHREFHATTEDDSGDEVPNEDKPTTTLSNSSLLFSKRETPGITDPWENYPFYFEKKELPLMFDKGEVTDKANETINIMYAGVEQIISRLAITERNVDMELFTETTNGLLLSTELQKNKSVWYKDGHDEMCARFESLDNLLEAIREGNQEKLLQVFYQAQHQHTLQGPEKRLEIKVYCEDKLSDVWNEPVTNAIESINEAAPGLHLQKVPFRNIAMIVIGEHVSGKPDEAFKVSQSIQFIHLGSKWPGNKNGTAIHELLHALGFMHEHQRFDAHLYADIDFSEQNPNRLQYKPLEFALLTRFDPFSIMMYPEDKYLKLKRKSDSLCQLKKDGNRCQTLSELDKVSLNLVYPPCSSDLYKPIISPETRMLYCGRKVMENHNQNTRATADTFLCGPKIWANCPACRVIKNTGTTKIQTCIRNGKWQGLSGLFYCGRTYSKKWFSSGVKCIADGVCGPDNGLPCNDCGRELDAKYDWQNWNMGFLTPEQQKFYMNE